MALEFRAASGIGWDRYIELRAAIRNPTTGDYCVAQPITFTDATPGEITQPIFRLDPDEARGLMDELWRAGVRPSSGEGNFGQLGAVQAHLQDMRRLVFHKEEKTNGA